MTSYEGIQHSFVNSALDAVGACHPLNNVRSPLYSIYEGGLRDLLQWSYEIQLLRNP